jgi:hypothetical protein
MIKTVVVAIAAVIGFASSSKKITQVKSTTMDQKPQAVSL